MNVGKSPRYMRLAKKSELTETHKLTKTTKIKKVMLKDFGLKRKSKSSKTLYNMKRELSKS